MYFFYLCVKNILNLPYKNRIDIKKSFIYRIAATQEFCNPHRRA